MAKATVDLYQSVTDQIISALEAGAAPWQCPWKRNSATAGIPRNLKTGDTYQGINVVLLWGQTQKMDFSSNYWLTFKQAKEMGGAFAKVRKVPTALNT
nr:ArdC family protein [Alkalilimnicola ehrlichii]